VNNILFDSGALHHSYVSEELIYENYDYWKDSIKPVSVKVKLGDNDTSVTVTEAVTLRLSLIDDMLKEHAYMINCYLWKIPKDQMIVGLPDILLSFGEVFDQLIQKGREATQNRKQWNYIN
jgi:hypothetical protein